MPKPLDLVRIEVGGHLIDLSWKTAQKLHCELICGGRHTIARQFVNQGTRAPIVPDQAEEQDLIDMIIVRMQAGDDEEARELLPLSHALRVDLASQSALTTTD